MCIFKQSWFPSKLGTSMYFAYLRMLLLSVCSQGGDLISCEELTPKLYPPNATPKLV